MTKKLAPEYGAASDATRTIAYKTADLSVDTSGANGPWKSSTKTRTGAAEAEAAKDGSKGMEKAERIWKVEFMVNLIAT